MLTIGSVTHALVVLGFSLTSTGGMKPELIARLDRAKQLYRPGITSMVVCGSHSFQQQGMKRFNEADVMAEYLRDIPTLKEGHSDSIQNNLLQLRRLAPRIRTLEVVSAEQVKERVGQSVACFFPLVRSYVFHGCDEPHTATPEREKKLRDDFDCIATWYAGVKKSDSKPHLKFLKGSESRWAEFRAQHHAECPSALGTGPHWNTKNPRSVSN